VVNEKRGENKSTTSPTEMALIGKTGYRYSKAVKSSSVAKDEWSKGWRRAGK